MGVIIPNEIPEYLTVFHAGYIEKAVTDYFKDPEHQKAFEKWKTERRTHENEVVDGSRHDLGHMDGGFCCMALRA